MSEDLPQPPTPMKRCKLFWRILLLSNFAFAAFIFAWGAKRKEPMEIHGRTAHKLKKGKTIVEAPPETTTSAVDFNYDNFLVPLITPVEVRAPIPEEQQREIFQLMLEEKRKVKPKDRAEEKQIDEEKAILKQFLRTDKSIPKF